MKLLNLRQGVCQQQQLDSDDYEVGVFTSKVQHLGNTVHFDVTDIESTTPRPAVVLSSVGSRTRSFFGVKHLEPKCCKAVGL